jgi:hypothetical protein
VGLVSVEEYDRVRDETIDFPPDYWETDLYEQTRYEENTLRDEEKP